MVSGEGSLSHGARGSAGFGVATGTLPLEAAKGEHVRYSGWIKTAGVSPGYAGLWMRADGPSGMLAFDNMQKPATFEETRTGTEYVLELLIFRRRPVNINFGVLHSWRRHGVVRRP